MSHDTNATPLSQRLKAVTREAHEGLDQRIMAFRPFSSLERYAAFLQAQYRFHRDVAPLFDIPALDQVLPGLRGRQRLSALMQDLEDLGQQVPEGFEPFRFDAGDAGVNASSAGTADVFGTVDMPTALGWLYVEGGSNLGAAFLIKAAADLGLGAEKGARHLAPLPGGRAISWKEFVGQLDGVALTPEAIERAEQASRTAFARVRQHVETCCPVEATQ